MAHNRLCTQLDVENIILQTFDNQPEAVITDLIARASAVAETYLHRIIGLDTGIVETHDGPWAPLIVLNQYPIDNVTTPVAITEDIGAGPVALVNGTDFMVYEDGRIVRRSGAVDKWWTKVRQGIVVTYDGGYAEIPRDIADATASMVARWFQAGAAYAAAPSSAGAVKRISLEGSDEIEYSDAVLDATITRGMSEGEMDKLNPWRATVFA